MAINFLNTVAVDENVLFVDTVNDRVGIGTDSPSVKLEVMSSSQTSSTAKFDSIELQTYTVNNSWVGENLYYDGSFKYRADGYATALYFAADGFDIRTAPSGTAGTVATLTTAFTLLESSGNVGIGVTGPSNKLHVFKDASLGSPISPTVANAGLRIQDNANSMYFDGNAIVSVGAGNLEIGAATTSMLLITNGAERMRITSSGNVGIGTTNPGSKLTVQSGVTDTSVNTVRFNHTRDDADVATQAMIIDMNLSGADTTTADRQNSAIHIDVDSSANGDASNEHRVRGITSDVRISGFSDAVQSGYFYAESNNNTQKTAQLIGVIGNAVHDSDSVDGGVTNMYGVYGTASIQDLGDVDNAYGGFFLTTVTPGRGADVGVTKGVEGKVSIDKAETINYGVMTAVSGIIDNNEGTVPNFGNQYLFKGDYQGTKGGNAYGIYTEGDKHYFDGSIGIGTTTPEYKLDVLGSANNADIGIRIKNSFDDNDPTSEPNAVLFLNAASNNGYLRVHGAPADTAAKHQIDLGSSASSSFLTFSLSGEKMRITSAGNVGIGANDPSEKLDVAGNIKIQAALLSNQDNTDVDTGTEVVAQVAHATYTAAFFDFVVKKGTNVRSGTVYACHNGDTTPLVEFTETSTNDLGDTSDVTLSVDISGTNMRLLATVTSDDWSVKSLIRAI